MVFVTNILNNTKLIQRLSFVINTDARKFQKNLSELTIPSGIPIFEQFGNKNKTFIGSVSEDKIVLRPKKKFLSFGFYYLSTYSADYTEKNDQVVIDGIISAGNHNFIFFSFLFIIILYSVSIADTIIGSQVTAALFILFHGLILIGILYFILRNSISKAKVILEEEFSLMNN